MSLVTHTQPLSLIFLSGLAHPRDPLPRGGQKFPSRLHGAHYSAHSHRGWHLQSLHPRGGEWTQSVGLCSPLGASPLHRVILKCPGSLSLSQVLKNITWYSERSLTEISLGSLLILVVIRTIQFNMTRTRVGHARWRGGERGWFQECEPVAFVCFHPEQDKYLHTNCLAALANMSAQFRSLHQYAAQRIIRWERVEKMDSFLEDSLSFRFVLEVHISTHYSI